MIRKKNFKLLEAMNKEGYNTVTLSKETRISRATISALINQKRVPNPSTAQIISNVLIVAEDELFSKVYPRASE